MALKMSKVEFLRQINEALHAFYDWADQVNDYTAFSFNITTDGELMGLSYYEPKAHHRNAPTGDELASLLRLERYGISALTTEICRLRSLVPAEKRLPKIVHECDTPMQAKLTRINDYFPEVDE